MDLGGFGVGGGINLLEKEGRKRGVRTEVKFGVIIGIGRAYLMKLVLDKDRFQRLGDHLIKRKYWNWGEPIC